MHKGSLVLSLGVLVLVLLTHEVRGDTCQQKNLECVNNMSKATMKVANQFGDASPNVTAITTECQSMQDMMTTCLAEMRNVCPANFDINGTAGSLQTSYNSVCGQNTICNMRLQECNVGLMSYSGQISSAMQQRPPDVQQIKKTCSQLKMTVTPCLDKLKAQCGSVPSVSDSISSITTTSDSLCSKGTLCQLQLGSCQPIFGNMSSIQDSQNVQKLCRIQQEGKRCLMEKMDAECLSLPEIQPIIQSINNTMMTAMCSGGSMQCPQAIECFARQNDDSSNDNSEQCSWPGGLMECVAGLRHTCKLKEEHITFDEVKTLSQQFCEEIKAAPNDNAECQGLGECVMSSDLMRKMYGGSMTSPSSMPQLDMSLLLDSASWCHYLEVVAGCYVSSVDTCETTDAGLLSFMTRQHKELKHVCSSSSKGVNTVMGDSTLVLLMAIFTVGARASL